MVDYQSLKNNETILDNYLKYLQETIPTENWSLNKEKAYWLNTYNAYTIKIILTNYPLKSIRDIKIDGKTAWKIPLIKVGENTYSLDWIEHEILRKKYNDPRIHVGINCASVSCPKLGNFAFSESNVETALTNLMIDFINDDDRNKISKNNVELSKIFDWFSSDFTKNGTIIKYLNNYASKKINEKAVKAVNDVSFKLFEGETLGLVGESGSGKSTIAKIITGLVRPTSGELEYNSLSLYNSKRKYQIDKSRGQIQMIFQDPYSSLNPRFKVKDIISEPIKFFQKNITRIDLEQNVNDLIDIVGMTRKSLDRYPHEFSGGQRQRISIARALATRPRLLICDEPTSALDVSIQAQILNLLKDIQDELHLTMLFISHDLPVIRQMCNRIIVLKNGAICETNETEMFFNEPSHQYTKQLINLMPKIESLI